MYPNLVTFDAFNLVFVFNFRLEKLPDRTALDHLLGHLALVVGQVVRVAVGFRNVLQPLLMMMHVLLFLAARFLKLFELRKRIKFYFILERGHLIKNKIFEVFRIIVGGYNCLHSLTVYIFTISG